MLSSVITLDAFTARADLHARITSFGIRRLMVSHLVLWTRQLDARHHSEGCAQIGWLVSGDLDGVGVEITLWSLVPRLKLGEILGSPVRLPRIGQTCVRISGGG